MIKKGDDPAAAREKIEKAFEKLKSGDSFETVAKEVSEGANAEDGGSLPFYARGELLKELEEAAFSLEVGKTSDVIETKLGYHIILVKARKIGRKIPLSEVWTEIEDQLFQERAQKMHQVWVDELKKKAHIRLYV